MPGNAPLVLALETSCDETAAAVLRAPRAVLASEVASQSLIHRRFGGVVPEVASRNHVVNVRPVAEAALESAGVTLGGIDAFAATAGPGLASSLLIGNSVAKAMALSCRRPFFAINHLEGHLLSPFLGEDAGTAARCGSEHGVRPNVALVVSGGHTLLVDVAGPGAYRLLGRTRDDAAGEAFDKVAKMLGLPYPGGPEIDRQARSGRRDAFAFPRSMVDRPGLEFSFSGLKTAVLYTLNDLQPDGGPLEDRLLADLCASFQEAVVDVLVEKTVRAAREARARMITVSGGVSGNARLREAMAERCHREGLELLVAPPAFSTDNAAMIAFAAAVRLATGGSPSPLDDDIDPNLPLVAQP